MVEFLQAESDISAEIDEPLSPSLDIFELRGNDGEFRRSEGDEGSGPPLQLEKSSVLQVAIDTSHGIGVHAEVYSQASYGGHSLTRSQLSSVDEKVDLFGYLSVIGRRTKFVYMKNIFHIRKSVLGEWYNVKSV